MSDTSTSISSSSKQNLQIFIQFLKQTKVPIFRLWIPIVFSLSSVIFEGISLSLLIPMLHGLIHNDFTFIQKAPGLSWLFPLISSWTSTPLEIFFVLIAIIFISTLLTHVLYYLAQLATSYSILQATYCQRRILFAQYFEISKTFLDHADRGYLIDTLMTFTQQVAGFLNHLQRFFITVGQNSVYMLLLLWISWRLTISIFVLALVLHFSLSWLSKRIQQNSYEQVHARKKLWRFMYNVLENWPLIQTRSMSCSEKIKFEQLSTQTIAIEWSMEKKTRLIGPFQQILIQSFVLVLVSIMAIQIWRGNADLAGFLVYLYLLRRLAGSMGIWNQFHSALAQLKAPLEEIRKLLNPQHTNLASVPDGTQIFSGLTKEIEFRHLTFAYPNQPAILQDYSCIIPKGKITAWIGQTGCGKSTLTSLLLRFYDVPEQTIFLDGQDIRQFRKDSLYQHIVILSQNVYLFHDTLLANLTYGCQNVREERIQELIKKTNLEELVSRLPQGIHTILGDHGSPLSGGEQQRVALIRLLLSPPTDIVILDEPTSFLDKTTAYNVWQLLQEELANHTIILITHHIENFMKIDKILSLAK